MRSFIKISLYKSDAPASKKSERKTEQQKVVSYTL